MSDKFTVKKISLFLWNLNYADADNNDVMTKSVNKIKDIIRLNEPTHNKKYNVWVVRTKTKTGWKAVWRKNRDDANDVYELLQKRIVEVGDKKDVKPPKVKKLTVDELKEGDKTTLTKISKSIVGKVFNKSTEKVKV